MPNGVLITPTLSTYSSIVSPSLAAYSVGIVAFSVFKYNAGFILNSLSPKPKYSFSFIS